MQREAWIEHLSGQAPFGSNRVSSIADIQGNVTSIHREAYEQLCNAAEEARQRPRGGYGAVVWSDPGVGKSHLLARFAQDLQQTGRGHLFFIHNLLSSPRLIPLSILKILLARLAAVSPSSPSKSSLYHWVDRFLCQAVPKPQGRSPNSIQPQIARQLYLQYVARTIQPELPDQSQPDVRRVAELLFDYFVAAYRLHRCSPDDPTCLSHQRVLDQSLQRLSGEQVVEEAESGSDDFLASAGAMTEPRDQVELEPNDQWIETVLLVLGELARQADQLIVLCFDQVENLSNERFAELFRFGHALLDHGRNLLIVTSGVRSDLVDLRARRLAPEAAWDRLASETIDLYFIPPAQARQLLVARMEPVIQAGCEIPEVATRLQQDPLFPLGTTWWQQYSGNLLEFRPRSLIAAAHQRWKQQCLALRQDWDRLLGEESVQESSTLSPGASDQLDTNRVELVNNPLLLLDGQIDARIRAKVNELANQPGSLPPDGGQLCGLIKNTLQRVARASRWEILEPIESGVRRRYDLLLRIPDMAALSSSAEAETTDFETSRVAAEMPPTAQSVDARSTPNHSLLNRPSTDPRGAIPSSDESAAEQQDENAGRQLLFSDGGSSLPYWTLGLVVPIKSDATANAGVYRRLVYDLSPPAIVAIVHDQRAPERLAAKGKQYKNQIQARTSSRLVFHEIDLTDYRELMALEAVLADARSRDIEIELPGQASRPVSEAEVEEAIIRLGHYDRSPFIAWLHALLPRRGVMR